ncbi:hypothetical protein GCM10023191_012670 [Actinoallomurus oryzae]|uniref:Uncharacterized protein n=2 Tax=Actinoallomurus oryzae TaxID=502180 RepID=A0ABP8PHT9_9ACTN
MSASTSEENTATINIVARAPSERLSVGDLISETRREIAFFGISAKRTVTEDIFRRALEKRHDRPIIIKFLLLDPSCKAFDERAKEEGEPSDAWRTDLETTVSRLRAFAKLMGVSIEMRLATGYPVWRAIIVDDEQVFVSTFLPGRRGTEAIQYCMSRSDVELTHGIIKSYQLAWKQARKVAL